MKKLVGLLMLAILSWQSCLAGTIDLKVNGVQVTTENRDDVLGDGTVCYDEELLLLTFTHTILLAEEGKAIVESRIKDLTIKFMECCELASGGTTCFILHAPTTLTGDHTQSSIQGNGHTIFRSAADLRFAGVRLETSGGPFYRSTNSTCHILTFDRPYIHHSFQGSPSAIDNVSALIMTNCHFATPGDAYFDPNVRSMRCGYGELLQGFDIMADDVDYIRSFTMSQPEKRTYDLQGRLHSGRGIWVSQQRKRLLKVAS